MGTIFFLEGGGGGVGDLIEAISVQKDRFLVLRMV